MRPKGGSVELGLRFWSPRKSHRKHEVRRITLMLGGLCVCVCVLLGFRGKGVRTVPLTVM